MIKEVITFTLRLGSDTDKFLALFTEVRAAMRGLGVEPGAAWVPLSGGRRIVVERQFESLADYEADDQRFHAGRDFMALWRSMEGSAESMSVEILRRRDG